MHRAETAKVLVAFFRATFFVALPVVLFLAINAASSRITVSVFVVARAIRQTGVRRLTIDVNGAVVSTGQEVQWAQRGAR